MLKTAARLIFLLLLVLGLTGCASNQGSSQLTVRIGFFPNMTHAQALVGKAQGQFQQEFGNTVKAQWFQFNAGSSEAEAMLAGAIDIAYIGPGPAINAFLKSQGDIKVIAGAADGGAILVSRRDLDIRSPHQLSGKKVAIPEFGNTQDLSLRYILQAANLKDTTKGGSVDILQADNSDIKTYFDQGYIDAALVPEPWGSRLMKEVNAKLVLNYNQIMQNGKYPAALVVVRKEFLQQHPYIVTKFLRAHLKITEELNAHPAHGKKVINQELKELTGKQLDQQVLDNAFSRLVFTTNPEVQAIDKFAGLIRQAGYLKEKPAIDQLVSPELLNKILAEQGLPKSN